MLEKGLVVEAVVERVFPLLRRSRRRLGLLVPVVVVGALVFILNRNPVTEQGIYSGQYVPYARFLLGEESREILTYPMWGYPFAIAVLGDIPLIALQFVLALLAVSMVFARIDAGKNLGRWSRLFVALLTVPWFALSSLNSAIAIAIPLLWISVILFFDALDSTAKWWRMAVAGALFGLALNFRSEFLLLAPVLALGGAVWTFVLTRPERGHALTILSKAAAFSFIAFLMLVPWGVFSHRNTGEFRLTSSNGGAVSVISLGQLPDNPWGIVHEDAEAVRLLREEGYADISPYSAEGDRILRRSFLDAITSRPVSYMNKVVHNARNVLMGGLYFGDWDHWLPGTNRERIDVFREKLKSRLGLNPNLRQIAMYKANRQWYEGVGAGEFILLIGAGSYLVVSILLVALGMVASLFLTATRRVSREVFVAILILLYVVALASLIQYQPRHINAAWPALIILGTAAAPHCRRLEANGRDRLLIFFRRPAG